MQIRSYKWRRLDLFVHDLLEQQPSAALLSPARSSCLSQPSRAAASQQGGGRLRGRRHGLIPPTASPTAGGTKGGKEAAAAALLWGPDAQPRGGRLSSVQESTGPPGESPVADETWPKGSPTHPRSSQSCEKNTKLLLGWFVYLL